MARQFEPAAATDLEVIASQLGRPVRDVVGIAARRSSGVPMVIVTKPKLSDGTPFPTFYYLTDPETTAAVSKLEAEGFMAELQELLMQDLALQAEYNSAHKSYLADRAEFGDPIELAGISAGGMPTRVKCLHALVAHSLAVGPGINPIGDLAIAAAIENGWSR